MTSIEVGCATRNLYASLGPKADGVPTNNRRRRGSGLCRFWGGLDKARYIVPTALLVRVQCFRNDLYKAVKGQSTRHTVLSIITGSILTTSKAFHYFQVRRDKTCFAFDPPYSLYKLISSKSYPLLTRLGTTEWKRKRSDTVLWQKPPHPQNNPKSNVTTQKRHQKLWLHNYCGPT